MICLTRFHSGDRLAVNPDLIERIEETPDTVVTLTNGTRYVVEESISEITEKVQLFRAAVFNLAVRTDDQPEAARATHLRVVRDATGRTTTE